MCKGHGALLEELDCAGLARFILSGFVYMESALSAGLPWIRALPAESTGLVVSASLADFLTRDLPEALLQQFVETTAIMR